MERNCKKTKNKKHQGGVIILRNLQGIVKSKEASKSNADLESGSESGSTGRKVSTGEGRALKNRNRRSILGTLH